MKRTVIKAFKGTGKEKVIAGEREVEMPETVAEAVKLFGEEDTLAHITSSYVIDVQRQIRAGTTESERAKYRRLVAAARTNPELAEMLRASGIDIWEEEPASK